MSRIRTYGKWVVAVIVFLILAQSATPFLFRNRRMRAYVLGHLEKSFGRPVEAHGFSMDILPFPQVAVDGVTVSEDPAFGNEYFLRADRLTAGVRWTSLLEGHFDFGTISLSRPSLILVRSNQGRWNLEGWLPPAAPSAGSSRVPVGPRRSGESANQLRKIEFDEGRINFKTGEEKRPFAFTEVSGSVEQIAPGRWQLRLEAQPWRSGVALQSTGTLQVRGEVAGTSTRLQPAELQVRWTDVSLADIFRMITGNDIGVRGECALDGSASIGKPESGSPLKPGSWKFAIHARASRIHRWDLIERGDNPSASLILNGVWDAPQGVALAEAATLDLPHSHFAGSAALQTAVMSEWNIRVQNAGVSAQDILAWYRAFQPDVAESVSATQFFTGRFALRGRPLLWQDAELSSAGGELRLPGFASPIRIGPVQGSTSKERFQLLPVHLFFDGAAKPSPSTSKAARNRPQPQDAASVQDQLEFRLFEDFVSHHRSFALSGKMSDVAYVFKAASAFGRTLNHGWELSGGASGEVDRAWNAETRNAQWNATLNLSKAQLQAAGLNLPLQLQDVRAVWNANGRGATVARADAFGAAWSGTIDELPASGDAAPQWGFHLHADHLDAKELDLWFGPRARPNWLQRLLASLLSKSESAAKPSELLRRISAEGDLTAETLTVEKVKLVHPRAHLVFRDLHLEVKEADAGWAGGTVHGNLNAVFSVPPQYEISAAIDRANLADFPWSPHWADRWGGAASGTFRLTTSGVGRDALLGQLAGTGELHLQSLALHGWDVPASLDSGTLRTGASRWPSGAGSFTIQDRAVQFNALQLQGPRETVNLSGTFNFSQNLDLSFTAASPSKHGGKASPPEPRFQLRGSLQTPVASVQTPPSVQAKKQE